MTKALELRTKNIALWLVADPSLDSAGNHFLQQYSLVLRTNYMGTPHLWCHETTGSWHEKCQEKKVSTLVSKVDHYRIYYIQATIIFPLEVQLAS